MRKFLLCSLLVLMGACVSFGQTVKQWKVVHVRSLSQNTGIPDTILFTPTGNSTYRVTATLSQKVVASGGSVWAALFTWKDVTGADGNAPMHVSDTADLPWSSTSFMLTVKAGTPFSYSVAQESSSSETFHFAFTVERLE